MLRFPPVVLGFVLILAAASAAPGAAPPDMEAVRVEVSAPPTAVTVYRGRAAVTRSTGIDLDVGLYDLVFSNLPGTVRPDTIQARARGGASVLAVEYGERAVSEPGDGRAADLDRRIEETRLAITAVDEERGLLAARERFLDALVARTTDDASRAAGTAALDLDAVRKQMAFVAEERSSLLETRRGLDARTRDLTNALRVLEQERAAIAASGGTTRTARVLIGVTTAGVQQIDLVYLVDQASWQPTYRVRAGAGRSTVGIEYDALVAQRSGEDWRDVAMTLSTAQPTVAANPPPLDPYFLDVVTPALSAPFRAASKEAAGSEMDLAVDRRATRFAAVEKMVADAEIGGAGPSVTFALPRQVSVETDSRRQQRTRIATIEAPAEFVHVATPIHSDAVYVRGDLTNASGYHLLPGTAAIFIDQDYVGPTELSSIAPGAEFDLFFGIDPAVTASRQLVTKKTTKTGLLGGGRRTSYAYRVLIDNNTGKAITLELRDRAVVSRRDEIKVERLNLSHPLSTDATYLEEDEPRGLLRWDLIVPAGAKGTAAMAVTWDVRITRPKDLAMTPLPE